MESKTFFAAVKAMQADVDMLKQENREGRIEVEASRKRIRYLGDENRDKDRRINVLRREKAELEWRLQGNTTSRNQSTPEIDEGRRDAPPSSSPNWLNGSPFFHHDEKPAMLRNDRCDTPQVPVIDSTRAESTRFRAARFSRLPSSHKDWANMLDDDKIVGAVSQEEALMWRTTKIRTADLFPAAWVLTSIAPFDDDQRYDTNVRASRNTRENVESPGRTQEAQTSPFTQDTNTNRNPSSYNREGYISSRSTSIIPRKRGSSFDNIDVGRNLVATTAVNARAARMLESFACGRCVSMAWGVAVVDVLACTLASGTKTMRSGLLGRVRCPVAKGGRGQEYVGSSVEAENG
ncbi:hypothetical protein LTR86_000652 [Recurvomyces mirabilis]|nr:hypothetical protein LTR86_000652 [Recurvomyces mirabilis]